MAARRKTNKKVPPKKAPAVVPGRPTGSPSTFGVPPTQPTVAADAVPAQGGFAAKVAAMRAAMAKRKKR